MKIVVDAAGGDYYPKNPVEGALYALQEREDLQIMLVGPEDVIRRELKEHEYDENRVDICPASQVVGMDEQPGQALKSKTDSSIAVGLGLHAKGKANAFVSAGNTGALMAASGYILGRLENVSRPAISTVYPTIDGFRLMVDVGANLEVKPEMYAQFAVMGRIYAQQIMGLEQPRIGLLNVGEEEEKGTETLKKAHQQLQSVDGFIGNVEGRDILTAGADVFVCDGYVGNVLLKFGESIPEAIEHLLRQTMKSHQIDQDQARALGGLLKELFEPFDYQRVGGVPFLGVNGVSLVGHGGSTSKAIKSMILSAAKVVDTQVNERIVASLNSG